MGSQVGMPPYNRGVPLSEHEQRILEEIEQRLAEDDPRLVEQDGPLEHVHGRRVEPRAQVDEPPAVGAFALDDRCRRLAGQAGGVQQIVVLQDPHRTGPLERRERGLDRTAERVVERQQARRLAGAEHEVRQPFGPVGEGANDQ